MSFFLKSGQKYKVTTKAALDIHERLPTGTYTVGFNECSGEYFLETIDSFEFSGKVYGDTPKRADRILKVFDDRQQCTGILLTGEKGSGKTMLAKQISMKAAARGVPTIAVNNSWCGEKFNSFMQMIDQPAVVIFDEFEKTYAKAETQEALLTLLDGVYPSKKLFVLTCNDKWRLNSNMRNRPGRIYYSIDYHGLEESFIREYCQDNLDNKDHTDMVCSISHLFSAFNFDMLKALVEEMNRFGETPAEALKFLNARPNNDMDHKYHVDLTVGGEQVKVSSREWRGNPLKSTIEIYERSGRQQYIFTADHLDRRDPTSGAYLFVNKTTGNRLVLRPMKISFDVDFALAQNMHALTPTDFSFEDVNSDDLYAGNDGGDY